MIILFWILAILVGFWLLGFTLDALEDGGWWYLLAVIFILWLFFH
jgi:hypothetical protein